MGLFGKKKAKQANPEADMAASAGLESGLAEQSGAEISVSDAEDGELIAVLAAAIAAYEAEQYQQRLYIQKINRLAGSRPVWGAVGTQEAIDARRMQRGKV